MLYELTYLSLQLSKNVEEQLIRIRKLTPLEYWRLMGMIMKIFIKLNLQEYLILNFINKLEIALLLMF